MGSQIIPDGGMFSLSSSAVTFISSMQRSDIYMHYESFKYSFY